MPVASLLDTESTTLPVTAVVIVADVMSVSNGSELEVSTVPNSVDEGLTVDVVGLTTTGPGF